MHSFRNVREAQAAGFMLAGKDRQYLRYKDCAIYCASARWARHVEAEYALRVEIPEDCTANYLGVRSDRFFGKSVPVKIAVVDAPHLADLIVLVDGIKTVEMFEPPTFAEAVEEAKEWIDRWFRYNPLAFERALLRRRESRLAGACS